LQFALQQLVNSFVEFFKIFFTDLCSAERTFTFGFYPLFNAACVEVVLYVARQRSNLVFSSKLRQTDRAFFCLSEKRRVKRPLSKTLNQCLSYLFAVPLRAHLVAELCADAG